MSQLFGALEGRDHIDSIILDVNSPDYMTIKGFENDFLPVEVHAAYNIIRELGPENIDESSVRLRTSILLSDATPQWFKDKLSKVNWSSSKEMKDRKVKQVSDFYESHIGKQIAAVLGYDLGGFHNSVMDSAARKKLKNADGKGTVVIKKIPKSMIDGQEIKNESFYGHDNEKGEFGVWDIVGWEYMPEENMFRNADGVVSVDPVGQHNAEIKSRR